MSPRSLRLHADSRRWLVAAGLAQGPEICGLPVAVDQGIEAVEITNVDPRADRFELDPDEAFAVLSRGNVVGAGAR